MHFNGNLRITEVKHRLCNPTPASVVSCWVELTIAYRVHVYTRTRASLIHFPNPVKILDPPSLDQVCGLDIDAIWSRSKCSIGKNIGWRSSSILKLGRLLYCIGLFFMAYQNLVGRCLVCKHGSHVIKMPKADWSRVKNKQLTATPC